MLNAAAITELTEESAPKAIFWEWLQKWFDGQAHAVGTNEPVVFPQCLFAFGEGPVVRQPLRQDGSAMDTEIRVIVLPRNEEAHWNTAADGVGKLVTSHVLFNFWISTKRPGEGESAKALETVGRLLKGILRNPSSRFELAEKGVCHLHPRAAQMIPLAEYARSLIACPGELTFGVRFLDGEGVAVGVAFGDVEGGFGDQGGGFGDV